MLRVFSPTGFNVIFSAIIYVEPEFSEFAKFSINVYFAYSLLRYLDEYTFATLRGGSISRSENLPIS
jgi:hypothetical protein